MIERAVELKEINTFRVSALGIPLGIEPAGVLPAC